MTPVEIHRIEAMLASGERFSPSDMLARPPLFGFDVRHIPSKRLADIARDLERAARRTRSLLLARKLAERSAELRRRAVPS